jgi:hypothetical protein
MPCPDRNLRWHPLGATHRRLSQDEGTALTGKAAAFANRADLCRSCRLVFTDDTPPRRLGHLDYIRGRGFIALVGYG